MTATITKGSTLRRLTLMCVLAALAALVPASTVSAAPTYDEAVSDLVSLGYPQSVETYLDSLGAEPLGFRLAGTDAEHAASDYVAAQLRGMGLKNVRLEPVPVDAYTLLGASVTVGEREVTASQFPGIPGTPPAGISGGVVYVHDGTAADFDAAGDVHGKIVLVDSALEYFWLNSPGAEATVRGATAVILTYGPHSYPWYAVAPDALGSNDGEYMDTWVPLVYLSRQDGDWLKAQLESGPVTATVASSVKVTPHDFDHPESGGVGHNVVAELPGTADDGSFVLVTSHLDAHFRCGLDDTGALVAELTMAKAMVMSDAKPRHTVVFLFTCGEEFGYGNAYFDYLAGAWWAITHSHPDWAGKAVAMLNLECFARPGAATADTTPDLAKWLRTVAGQKPGLLPWGLDVSPVKSSWDDGWPLLAAGVPSVTLAATGDDFWERYHSTWETKETVDWQYLGRLTRFVGVLQRGLDKGLLPYDLQARARAIQASVPADELRAAGLSTADVTSVTRAARGFKVAAARFTARKGSIPASRAPKVNEGLRSVIDEVCSNLTALSAWEDTVYPHQQVLWDVLSLNATLAELQRPSPRPRTALKALANVGKTAYGLVFSQEAYEQDIARLEPDYPVLTWGALGHLAPQLDVLKQYRMVEAGQYAAAAAELKPMRDADRVELVARVDSLDALLRRLTRQVNALR
jgi:Iap family predicted aminopeptidase